MKKIDSTYLSYKCPLKWDELNHSEVGTFCDKCQNEVYDLRDCSIEDVSQLQKEKGIICGLVPLALLTLASCTSNEETPPQPQVAIEQELQLNELEGLQDEIHIPDGEAPVVLGFVCPVNDFDIIEPKYEP